MTTFEGIVSVNILPSSETVERKIQKPVTHN